MKFAKGGEQSFSAEIFRTTKVIERPPLSIYELEDLKKTQKEGQFYGEKLTPVRISKQTTYKLDKILDRRFRRGIKEYLVRWRSYSQDCDSWLSASRVKESGMTAHGQNKFYVPLQSNASRDIYEQNTHADFTAKVAQSTDLFSTSNWEVGVCEISFSLSLEWEAPSYFSVT